MWFLMVRVDFVSLAHRTSLDVFLHVLLQIWPPIVLFQECGCVADSQVSAVWWVVKCRNYPLFKIVVAGNN